MQPKFSLQHESPKIDDTKAGLVQLKKPISRDIRGLVGGLLVNKKGFWKRIPSFISCHLRRKIIKCVSWQKRAICICQVWFLIKDLCLLYRLSLFPALSIEERSNVRLTFTIFIFCETFVQTLLMAFLNLFVASQLNYANF